MTGKDFFLALVNGRIDLLAVLREILTQAGADHCVIGGLAVNAYAEPVVSLDVDIVVAQADLDRVHRFAAARGLRVEQCEHTLNLRGEGSDLRVQIQLDPRYQAFLTRAVEADVLGYPLRVAARQDVLQGKIWAWSDAQRRRSKRQKDLADIARMIEAEPALAGVLPAEVREALDRT